MIRARLSAANRRTLVLQSSILLLTILSLARSPNSVAAAPIAKASFVPSQFAPGYRVLGHGYPAIGRQTLLVILVDFLDVHHTKNLADVESVINQLEAYYVEVSYHKMSIAAQVYGWYTVNQTMSYYGHDAKNPGDDNNVQQLASDALALLPASVDVAQFKLLMIVHAGQDQADDQYNVKSDEIWSQCFCSVFPFYQATTEVVAPDGRTFGNYMFVSEFDGYGTFAHEFGHSLGLPDLYDTSNSHSFVGFWSLMDSGNLCCENNAENTPSYIGGWGAALLGWLNPDVADLNVLVSSFALTPLESPNASVVLIPVSATTYYFIEDRIDSGSDAHLPQSGILVYYVDESKDTGSGILRLVNPTTGALYPEQTHATSLENVVFKISDKFSDPANRVYLTFSGTLNAIDALYSTQAVTSPVVETSITAARNSLSGLYDENLSTSGTLLDQNGLPIEGQTVEIEVGGPEGGWNQLASSMTNVLGVFSFQQPLKYSVGLVTLRYFYAGGKEMNRWLTSSEAEFSVNVLPGQMILTVSTPEFTFDSSRVDVTVVGTTGATLPGVTLTLYLNNLAHGTSTTDSNGHATFRLDFPGAVAGEEIVTVTANAQNYQSTQSSNHVVLVDIWLIALAVLSAAACIGAGAFVRLRKTSKRHTKEAGAEQS